MLLKIFIIILAVLKIGNCAEYKFSSEQELVQFLLTEYERNQTVDCYRMNVASYNYNIDLSDKNDKIMTDVTLKSRLVNVYYYNKYFKGLNPNNFSTEWLRRQIKDVTKIGNAALSAKEYEKLVKIINSMTAVYGKAKICPYFKPRCNSSTEGLAQDDIEALMANSSNPDELSYYWQSWRIVTGRQTKNTFREYVRLKNLAANLNGFSDAGAMWRYEHEIPKMEYSVSNLWRQIEPLYLLIHDYVLRKLSSIYGPLVNVTEGLLPAHLTGNNFAQTWEHLGAKIQPFPEARSVDVTAALKSKGYGIMELFETANEFYTSLGLADMRMAYGERAMLTKTPEKEVVCHPSAWDFCIGTDFRISMCTEVDRDNFATIHHELGHIQYYIQYRRQPIVFRTSANPGFHEAIGDAIQLSVINHNHLKRIGLLPANYNPSYESTINDLMQEALENVPMFAFTYLVDRWRWDVFKGIYEPGDWNRLWWSYRTSVQRLKPPVARVDADFDPAAKFHVVSDTEYIPYFIAQILKFQIYRGLCIAAGEYNRSSPNSKPLHECDYYQSKIAGAHIKAGLELGSSVHWSKVLKLMTGETELDTSAVFDYFNPLIEYLNKANRKQSLFYRHKNRN